MSDEVPIDGDLVDLLRAAEQSQQNNSEPVTPPVQPVSEPTLNVPVVQEPIQATLTTPTQNNDDIGIKVLLNKFGDSVNVILNNQLRDREQVESAILFFEAHVRQVTAAGGRLSPSYIEAWSTLLRTKTEINTNATGVLDSIARLLSAGKKNDLIINLGASPGSEGIDLETLLSQPKKEDEK